MDNKTTESNSDADLMRKMEDEHLRLQRQVRIIQTDRQDGVFGVHPQFRRQDHLLKTLKREYVNIVKDLKIAKSGAHKKNDKRMKIDLKTALLHKVKIEMEAEAGVNLMDELEGLLQKDHKNMLLLRKLAIANKGQVASRRSQSESRLISTENRLEKVKVRFDTLQNENKKIREEIEHMLKDRALFNQAWTKILGSLNKGKKFLTDLFESSTLAYDQRDELCAKLRYIQEKGRIDQAQQVQEMRELSNNYDHEMKLYKFLAKKGIIRVNEKVELKEIEDKIREEEKRRSEFEEHQKILDEIKSYANEYDVDTIIRTFDQTEQQNFSTYRLLTEYCAQNVSLKHDLDKVRRDVDDRRDFNDMMEDKRANTLEKLTRELGERQMENEGLRSKLQDRLQLLEGTMVKVGDIFNFLGCSLEPFQNLLGDKQPSLRRLNLTLRLITERIMELIQIVYYSEHKFQLKKSDRSTQYTSRLKKYTVHVSPQGQWTPLPMNIMVPGDPCPSCVEARWLSRVTEVLEVPFDRTATEKAIHELDIDPAFVRSDRIHPLTDCKVPQSRNILAKRYTSNSM